MNGIEDHAGPNATAYTSTVTVPIHTIRYDKIIATGVN